MSAKTAKVQDRAIRPAQLQEMLGLSRSAIHRLHAAGLLPSKRRYTGGSSIFYIESEILEFMKNQPQV
ncbi:MAG: helix-turn-helix domain-containing protein [Desulfuromonadaceae bacterium]|nr:helix-turn-helix domain-containing protein [Desulfuromonadaceae bacterium]